MFTLDTKKLYTCRIFTSRQQKGIIMNEKMKKTYLCKEGNEEFYIEAENIEQARELVEIYNAVVIREMPNKIQIGL